METYRGERLRPSTRYINYLWFKRERTFKNLHIGDLVLVDLLEARIIQINPTYIRVRFVADDEWDEWEENIEDPGQIVKVHEVRK